MILPPAHIILVPKTADHLFHLTRNVTESLQVKVGVIWGDHRGKLDESVRKLPLEVG